MSNATQKIILGLVAIAVVIVVLIVYFALQRGKQRLTIEQAKERHETELMTIDGVVGVGIGECEGRPCVKVFLEEASPEVKRHIPTELDGFKVDVEVTGALKALPE